MASHYVKKEPLCDGISLSHYHYLELWNAHQVLCLELSSLSDTLSDHVLVKRNCSLVGGLGRKVIESEENLLVPLC